MRATRGRFLLIAFIASVILSGLSPVLVDQFSAKPTSSQDASTVTAEPTEHTNAPTEAPEPTKVPTEEIVPTYTPAPVVDPDGLPRLESIPSSGQIEWSKPTYYDIGSSEEPHMTHFSGSVDDSSVRGEEWSCNIGGFDDWTYRTTDSNEASTIYVPVEQNQHTLIKFCTEDGPGETDWHTGFLGVNPEIFDCVTPYKWTFADVPQDKISSLTIQLDKSCVISDEIGIAFLPKKRTYRGVPVWGLTVQQGHEKEPVPPTATSEPTETATAAPTEEPTEPKIPDPTPTTAQIRWDERIYYDIGSSKEPDLEGFNRTVRERRFQESKWACDLGNYNDWTYRYTEPDQTSIITIPAEPNRYVLIRFCTSLESGVTDWTLRVEGGNSAPQSCAEDSTWTISEEYDGVIHLIKRIDSSCVVSDELRFEIHPSDPTYQGFPLWGLAVWQGDLKPGVELSPTPQPSPTPTPEPTPVVTIVGQQGDAITSTYYDLGVDDEGLLQGFEPGTFNGDGMCLYEDEDIQDDTKRHQIKRTTPPFTSMAFPVTRYQQTTISFCIFHESEEDAWELWLGGNRPEISACSPEPFATSEGLGIGLHLVSFTIPPECITGDEVESVFMFQQGGALAVYGVLVEQDSTITADPQPTIAPHNTNEGSVVVPATNSGQSSSCVGCESAQLAPTDPPIIPSQSDDQWPPPDPGNTVCNSLTPSGRCWYTSMAGSEEYVAENGWDTTGWDECTDQRWDEYYEVWETYYQCWMWSD